MRHSVLIAILMALLLLSRVSPGSAAPASSSNSGSSSKSDSSSDDKDSLVGTWVAVEGEYQGQPTGKKTLDGMTWTITATTLSRPSLNKVVDGKLILNPKASP